MNALKIAIFSSSGNKTPKFFSDRVASSSSHLYHVYKKIFCHRNHVEVLPKAAVSCYQSPWRTYWFLICSVAEFLSFSSWTGWWWPNNSGASLPLPPSRFCTIFRRWVLELLKLCMTPFSEMICPQCLGVPESASDSLCELSCCVVQGS